MIVFIGKHACVLLESKYNFRRTNVSFPQCVANKFLPMKRRLGRPGVLI